MKVSKTKGLRSPHKYLPQIDIYERTTSVLIKNCRSYNKESMYWIRKSLILVSEALYAKLVKELQQLENSVSTWGDEERYNHSISRLRTVHAKAINKIAKLKEDGLFI